MIARRSLFYSQLRKDLNWCGINTIYPMACRLPKQIGVNRADISDNFHGKSILLIGLFTRSLQISAKWAGMRTICIDGFCPFDLKKTADCCAELLDSDTLTLQTLLAPISDCNNFDSSKLKSRIQEIYNDFIVNLLNRKFDYIYPDSYFFNSVELWSAIQDLENIVVKVVPSKIPEFQTFNSSLMKEGCIMDESKYRLTYVCAMVEDTIEVLMKTIEIYEIEKPFPIIKSTLQISKEDDNIPQFIKIREIATDYSLVGIVEFIFTIKEKELLKESMTPDILIGIRPYIDANCIELFETATGINLIDLDLQLISQREFPHQLFREDAKSRIRSAFDGAFRWCIFRFFSPVRFSVFSDIGGYGFRDYPMPGTQILLGNPICSEIVQNSCEEDLNAIHIYEVEELQNKYQEEKEFVHKILGLRYYLKNN